MLRVFLSLSAVVVVIATPLAACDDKCNIHVGPCQPECPEAFQQGAECERERQLCTFSTGKCREIEAKRTLCTCVNQPVGLRWECQIRQCSCICPCGVSMIQSCDSMDCAEPEDECPAKALDACQVWCAEPDAGPDQDAGPDAAASDASVDVAPDTAPSPDQSVDVAPDTAPPDTAPPDTMPPDTMPPDTILDLQPPDATGDLATDGTDDAPAGG